MRTGSIASFAIDREVFLFHSTRRAVVTFSGAVRRKMSRLTSSPKEDTHSMIDALYMIIRPSQVPDLISHHLENGYDGKTPLDFTILPLPTFQLTEMAD